MKKDHYKEVSDWLRDKYQYVKLVENGHSDSTILSSGIPSLDVAIGVGGYPSGRVVILHGPESCGKTTVALHAVVECQKRGGLVIYMDFERKLNRPYAAKLGVDLSSMVLAEPPNIEEAFKILTSAAEKAREIDPDCPILFVWDSLHAAISKRTETEDYDKDGYPPEPRAYSKGFAKFVPVISDSQTVMMCISQVRMKMEGYGRAEKVAVGNAPLFYASLILKFKTKPRATVATGRIGENVDVVAIKNCIASPWQTAAFPIIYGEGVDYHTSLLSAAVKLGLAEEGKSGWASISIGDQTKKVRGGAGLAQLPATEIETLVQSVYEAIAPRSAK